MILVRTNCLLALFIPNSVGRFFSSIERLESKRECLTFFHKVVVIQEKVGERFIIYLCSVLLLTFSNSVFARDNVNCGSLENGFGPFDYTDRQQYNYSESLHLVETAHFTKEIQRLSKGNTGKVSADLDYTLRAFPNHHRALYAMAHLLRMKERGYADKNKIYTAQCYFDRAIRLVPSDYVTWMLYGLHLQLSGDLEDSRDKYLKSIKINKEYAESHYNIGLLYFEMKEFEQAKLHSDRAKELGYPLDGLAKKIESIQKKSD